MCGAEEAEKPEQLLSPSEGSAMRAEGGRGAPRGGCGVEWPGARGPEHRGPQKLPLKIFARRGQEAVSTPVLGTLWHVVFET